MHYIKCTGRVKVAFVFQVGSFWPSWESLYESCIHDDRFEVKLFWIKVSKDTWEEGDRAQMQFAEDFLKAGKIPYEPFSYEKIMEFMPHYMVYQTPYDHGHRKVATWSIRYKRKGIRIVYIPYGIEISDTEESHYKHFALPVVQNAFAVYTLSEAMKEEYEKYCINAKAVRALGLPRFDSLLRKYEPLSDVKERAQGRKIILWKSHFPKIFIEAGVKKQATPDLGEYLKFVEYIAKTQSLFFVFMPHPKFADVTIDEELLPRAIHILEELDKLPNVYIDKGEDYRNSLTNADAIIIDRSAVMVEAGIKGVPVMYMYNTDYKEPMTPPIQHLLDSYEQGTTAAEMIDFCDRVKTEGEKERKDRLKRFSECVPFLDGKCAERIKTDLWQAAQNDDIFEMIPEIGPGARVVIFGTGDMCNISMAAYLSQEHKKFDVICFADNDRKKQGQFFYDREIVAPDSLEAHGYDYIVIATVKYYREVYLQLTERMGIPKNKIMNYDEFVIITKYES